MWVFFSRIFSLAHVCHVVGSSEYSGTMWPFNGTFSQWFYIYSVSSSTMLKVTWNPEWNVILRSVGRYRKSFDGRSWYVHGFSWLVLLRHVTSRELTRHSCRDDMGLKPVGKSGSLRSVYIPSFRFSFFYFIIENRKGITKHPFPFF